jgi:hypothetical protein
MKLYTTGFSDFFTAEKEKALGVCAEALCVNSERSYSLR